MLVSLEARISVLLNFNQLNNLVIAWEYWPVIVSINIFAN